jgi:predicted nucleotidyltransferase component of viral defense system
MSEPSTNITASIHARLANEARKLGRPFNEELQYYGMERFLYRLSKTQYAGSFILKGGLVLYVWGLPLRRPTKDIDFLGSVENRNDMLYQVVEAAINVPVTEDGIRFDMETVIVEETQVDTDQKGIRVKLTGSLGRARIPIQMDIGFSDEITSAAKTLHYPTILHDMAAPELKGYPLESIVSEKFHAMQRYAELPSRWKDYYDIWLISNHFEFDSQSLQAAIAKTFEIRGTEIPIGQPMALTPEFARKYDGNWKQFLKRLDLENEEIDDLLNLVEKIWVFLGQPVQELAGGVNNQKRQTWNPNESKWM